MSKDNYQNFIYLFNNPNSISLRTYGINLDNDDSTTTIPFSNEVIQILYDESDIPPSGFSKGTQIVRSEGIEGDFPFEAISLPRLKQKNVLQNIVLKENVIDRSGDVVVQSNDPGLNPNRIFTFSSEKGKLIAGVGTSEKTNPIVFEDFLSQVAGSYKYKLVLNPETSHNAFLFNSIDLKSDFPSSPGYATLVKAGNLYTSNNLPNDMTFNHIRVLHVDTESNPQPYKNISQEGMITSIKQFFLRVYEKMASNSAELGNVNFDIACKIGVPYDFQTVLNEKVNEKNLGISIKQPNYEKIYNYYDPQYEPAMITLIENAYIEEKSLPSIYDFLYIEQHRKIEFMASLPGFGSPKQIRFSNINSYLDKFASVYMKHFRRDSEQLDTEGIWNKYISAPEAAIQSFKKNPLSIMSAKDFDENSPNNLLSSKIRQTMKSSVQQALEYSGKDTEQNLIDLGILEESKKTQLPKWIDSLKTGIYFTENSIDLFTDTNDKDEYFPFLIKVNLPIEKKGPLAEVFSKYGFLDNINTYAASINTPTYETNENGEYFSNAYDVFYGGVVNGYNKENYNLYNDLNLPSFKLYLKNKPINAIIQEAVSNSSAQGVSQGDTLAPGSKSGTNNPKNTAGAQQPPGVDTAGLEQFAAQQNNPTPVEEEPSDEVLSEEDLSLLTIERPEESKTDLYLNSLEAIGANSLKNVFVYDLKKEIGLPDDLTTLLEKIKTEKFKTELKDFLVGNKLIRTPTEINHGKLAHQETLMYEIAKYRVDADGEQQYVQSIFLPICDKDNLSYYDTQVIPYQDYFYKIYAHKAIVGTKYEFKPYSKSDMVYVDMSNSDDAGLKPRIFTRYEVEPFIQIVRVPYYNTREVNIKVDKLNYSRVEDAPPLAPQINFTPFRNVDNKLLLLFSNSNGQILQYPKTVLPEDKLIFEDIYISQDRKMGSQLLFKSDDSVGTYQVFRTETLPRTYKDAPLDSTYMFKEIKQPEDPKKAPNTSLIDTIEPNRNYYYFFRFKDIHNKLSNPTIIYRVQMVKEEGSMSYLKVDPIDLEETRKDDYNNKFTFTKTLQKYLFMELTDSQKQVNYDNVEIDYGDATSDPNVIGSYSSANVTFSNNGSSNESVFGKKFKLRLTSKQTGKKIDINLKVKSPETKLNN